jgi:hypothetical protein
MRHFARDARVLISTQTGGEGFNLQFCHQLVNYDLPWNPMMASNESDGNIAWDSNMMSLFLI